MKLKFSNITLIIIMFFAVSCEEYLTVLPENNQSTVQFWKTKEDVETVLGAGYVKLRAAQENLFLWGEARGNGIYFSASGTSGQLAAQKLRQFDILANNELAKWDKLYSVINMANSVIKYAPQIDDASFNENVRNSYLSEAYFLRSLSYFWLVRLWRDVPFVKVPYIDDSAPYDVAQTPGNIILQECLVDLQNSLEAAKTRFPEIDATNPVNTKGRSTKWSIYSLIADINLWLGNYEATIDACEAVINSGQVGLISGANWFLNYFPGNSNESIFEIQYSYGLNQTNAFITWFSTNKYYYISPYQQLLFEANAGDKRGLNASYNSSGFIWKYIGINATTTTARNSSLQNDQNYILYRLADVYLMEAEAYIMKGDSLSLLKGLDLINIVRQRAGINASLGSSEQLGMIQVLIEERQREFFAEGKNWFDLLRIGIRTNPGFKDLFIEGVLQVASASNSAMIRAILQDQDAWYLPVHTDELTTNKLLVQNPYYANLGN